MEKLTGKKKSRNVAASDDSMATNVTDTLGVITNNSDLVNNVLTNVKVIFDGPLEIGIVSGGDAIFDDNDRYVITRDVSDTLLWAGIHKCDNKILARAMTAVIFILLKNHDRLDPKYAMKDDFTVDEVHIPDDIIKYSAQDEINGLLFVYTCKINWWLTNHHIGRSVYEASNLLVKVLNSKEINNPSKNDLRLLWKVSNWCATLPILYALGVTSKLYTDDMKQLWPLADPSLKVRVRAHPAGTARWFDACAVMDKVRTMEVAMVIETTIWEEHDRLRVVLKKIMEDPIKYHQACATICKQTWVQLEELSDRFKTYVATCVEAFFADDTIGKCASLKGFPRDINLKTQLRAFATHAADRANAIVSQAHARGYTGTFGPSERQVTVTNKDAATVPAYVPSGTVHDL